MIAMNLKRSILDMAVDDFTGLWEIAWRARSLMPEAGEEEIQLTATQQARDLVEQDLLALFRGVSFTGEEVQLSRDESLTAVSDRGEWAPPEAGAVHLRVAATEAGEKAYQRSANAGG